MGETGTEPLQPIEQASYGDNALSRTRVSEWHLNCLTDLKTGVCGSSGDHEAGVPQTSRNADTIAKVRA
jgi:hypothetical protein